MCIGGYAESKEKPEVLLAKAFKDDLGVEINPQALRMFIRMRWIRVAGLAHAIHDYDAGGETNGG
jgi:hypothetical protein